MATVAGLGLSLVACSAGGPPTTNGGQATSRRGSSTGGGGETGGNGSTTGGQGACNPSPGSCPPPGTHAPLDNCPGQVELVANLVDFDFASSSEPVICPIILTDLYNPDLSVTTDLCGYIRYCIAAGTQISFSAQVAGYIPVNFATMVVQDSSQIPDTPGIPMAKTSLLSQLPTFLPNADPSDAMVIVEVQAVDPSPNPDAGPDAQACANPEGWQVWLEDASGDPIDAGMAYLINDTLDPSSTHTDSNGFVFFYNVDPSVQTVSPRGYRQRDALPDGGSRCGNPENGPPLGFTGRVPIIGGDLSVIPYLVGPN